MSTHHRSGGDLPGGFPPFRVLRATGPARAATGAGQPAEGTGVRIALIRRPGRHADTDTAARHEVLIAHTSPADPWVRRARLDSPAALLDLDFAALGAGRHDGFGTEHVGDPIARGPPSRLPDRPRWPGNPFALGWGR
ncbi:hypothetical protein [Kitasatospora griseola]|uniref:hypothetical protein n=1 Tax=Kitasatospora griseola TaxID=2064 RepID=UPI00381679C6